MVGGTKTPGRSGCPIATTLDMVGDRWSLVIVRDVLVRKKRFGEFLDSPEGIPTNILANRLKRLENSGFLTKHPYRTWPLRFKDSLTEQGEALLPILQAICRWATRQYPDTWKRPQSYMRRRAAL